MDNQLTVMPKDEYLEFEVLKPKTVKEERQEFVTATKGKVWDSKVMGCKLPTVEDIEVGMMKRVSPNETNGLKRIN